MGYYSDFVGEIELSGIDLNTLAGYGITTEPAANLQQVNCKGFSTGFYLESPEPTGFRVEDHKPAITIFAGDEPEKGYGFSDFITAIYKLWRLGHVKRASFARRGEDSDDMERYFLKCGRWKTLQVIEKTVAWKGR